jgi:DNA polymerase III sliding clamp (beta) subunit (PCNA family)
MTTQTVKVDAQTFARAAANASLFASKDRVRPTLTHVLVTVKEEAMTLEATDSYALYRETVPCEGDELNLQVLATDLATIVKACKASAGPLSIDHETGREVTFGVGSASFTVLAGDFDWPRTDSFFDQFVQAEVGFVGLGSNILTRVAKVMPTDGKRTGVATGEAVCFSFATALKPVEVTWPANDAIRMVVIPVKIAGREVSTS